MIIAKGSAYRRLTAADGVLDIGDPDIALEIIGLRLEPGGQALPWFDDKGHTINGNSLVFRLTYGVVRTFFSGDLNEEGSNHLFSFPARRYNSTPMSLRPRTTAATNTVNSSSTASTQ